MKIKLLTGALLSSSLLLLIVLGVNKLPSITNQQASVIQSTNIENIYNISPSKEIPGMYNFNYVYDKVTTNLKKGEKLFDAPIVPFDDELARKILEKEYNIQDADFGSVRDSWNYPIQPNAFHNIDPKDIKASEFSDMKKGNKGTGNTKNLDESGTLGVYNCRENTSVTGYFRAYFADVSQNTDIGYDDPTYGEGRRFEACQVLQDVSELIMLDEISVTPVILFDVDPNIPENVLMGASSNFDYSSSGLNNGRLHQYIISRQDPAAGTEARVVTNFNNIDWDVDLNLNGNTYDMYTVLYHEVLHTLGFRGRLLADIYSSSSNYLKHGTLDYFSYKDQTLSNSFVNHLTNLIQVPTGQPSPWFITNQVVYQGVKNIVGATPDAIKPIYSPATWEQGSSLSHFDMNRAPGETFVMHPSIGTNTERQIDNDEKDVLCHLGYMVEGVCEDPTPSASNDVDVVDLNSQNTSCVNPLLNDTSFSGGDLSINSVSNINIQPGDTITYYSNVNCAGSVLSSASGAKSVRFNLAATAVARTIQYKNKDSVTNRISFPALVTVAVCTFDPGEYVCNGDFEMESSANINSYNQAFKCPGSAWRPDYLVFFWCKYFGTPDLLSTSYPAIPSILTNGGNQLVNMWLNNGESIITILKSSLIVGQEYILSFDLLDNAPIVNSSQATMQVGLNVSDIQYPVSYTQAIINESIDLSINEWQYFEQNFIADDAHKYLILTGANVFTSGNLNIFLDNISIRPANSTSIPGCTNPLASNYNPLATVDDGSCIISNPN
ncbi:MAG: hypothetical protein KBC29_03950, partial [Candidatus Pacebacteria bacterium]|nr:hypothetical protein [Candidatus Paceibacterota bacterium]